MTPQEHYAQAETYADRARTGPPEVGLRLAVLAVAHALLASGFSVAGEPADLETPTTQ